MKNTFIGHFKDVYPKNENFELIEIQLKIIVRRSDSWKKVNVVETHKKAPWQKVHTPDAREPFFSWTQGEKVAKTNFKTS